MNNSDLSPAGRMLSLDAFRGFTILLMYFVGFAGEIPGTTDVLKHAPQGVDTITLADLVFPGFLFMVGIAIPQAVERRLAAGESPGRLVRHILKRTGGLLLLGMVLYTDDAGGYSEAHTGLPKPAWFLSFYLAVIVFWTAYPPALQDQWPGLVRALRWGAAGVMVMLLAIFRTQGADGAPHWFTVSTSEIRWGLLGMIGWTYFLSSLVYLVLSRTVRSGVLPGLIAALVVCAAFYTAAHVGWLAVLQTPWLNLPGLFGAHATAVLAGVVTGRFFFETSDVRRRVIFLLLWAGLLLALGSLLRPLQGANKVDGTASYCLLSAGIIALSFLSFFLLFDVAHARRLAAFLLPIGTNALLGYLMWDLWCNVLLTFDLWQAFSDTLKNGGLPAIITAMATLGTFALVLSLSKRCGIVLRL